MVQTHIRDKCSQTSAMSSADHTDFVRNKGAEPSGSFSVSSSFYSEPAGAAPGTRCNAGKRVEARYPCEDRRARQTGFPATPWQVSPLSDRRARHGLLIASALRRTTARHTAFPLEAPFRHSPEHRGRSQAANWMPSCSRTQRVRQETSSADTFLRGSSAQHEIEEARGVWLKCCQDS